jgi:hypothetical protein
LNSWKVKARLGAGGGVRYAPVGSHGSKLTRRDLIILCIGALGSIALLVTVYVWGASSGRAEAVAEPSSPSLPPPIEVSRAQSPVVEVDPSQAPAPGMDPQFAPPDGPAPDYPPFDVDAISMRDELRSHGVDTPDDHLVLLVSMADKYIAQNDPDLDAWDPRIMRDVRTTFPGLDKPHVIDVTRCTAEYIERVIARNMGWAHPPDEDDHDVTVQGRGPQTRVAHK